MANTVTRERGFALLGDIKDLMPGKEKVGGREGIRIDVAGMKGSFHTHPDDGNPELSASDWAHAVMTCVKLQIPFLECSGSDGDVYCTTVDDIHKLAIPKRFTDEVLDELVQHLVEPYHFRV
ncbi:unnamed protein product [marine sediment metagenome]|uniref:Uncharacterized protein n=1 Tax=marine sediment metagenome TaxID=412755 RepID=X1SKF9_9ZZZZ